MIRIGTLEDLDLVLEMALKFAAASPYKDLADLKKIREIVTHLLSSDPAERLILIYEDKGFLAAGITEFLFGGARVATEIAWWVEPEYRKEGVGDKLVEAFEYWADKLNCKVKTLAFMDKDLSNYMKKKGYVPSETVHYKMN